MVANISLRIHWHIGMTLTFLLFASGCVILPDQVPSETRLKFMYKDAVGFIEVGKSSRDDVLHNLGSPTLLSAKPSIWIYSMREYLSTRWRVCHVIASPYGVGSGCSKASEGKERYSFLEIQFDSSRIVTHRQISSLAIGECTEAGFCWNGLPAFRATRGARIASVNHCAAHIYTPNTAISAKLKINASDEFNLSLTNNDFQLILLQRQQPLIVFSFDDGSKKRVRVPCDTESAHFVRIDREMLAYNVRLVPEHDGRRVVIGKRTMTRVNF